MSQAADHCLIGDLVQDLIVDKAEDLARQVLRQLGDERKADPAFTAALCDAADLLEQDRHLLYPAVRKELVRLLDDD